MNWIAEGFWFRCPLLEVEPAGVAVAASARNLLTALLGSRLRTGAMV